MNPISISPLPPGAIVLFNSLYPSKNPEFLTQDLLAVRLPAGIVVDVSWYPEHDPGGGYFVTAFDHNWRNRLACLETSDPFEAVRHVSNLASIHSSSIGFVSVSTSRSNRPYALTA